MKTLYLKTTMKLFWLLPALIFFMLALSYNARSQDVLKTPVCYGDPIQFICNYPAGCDNPASLIHWENFTGSWSSSEANPVLYAPGTPYVFPGGSGQTYTGGLCNGEGYNTDKFYLSIQGFEPPPGGFYGGRVTVTVLAPIIVRGTPTPVICYGGGSGTITLTVSGGQLPYSFNWSNGSHTQNQTGLTAGSYTVSVTDAKNCSQASSAFVINEALSQLTLSGTPVPV